MQGPVPAPERTWSRVLIILLAFSCERVQTLLPCPDPVSVTLASLPARSVHLAPAVALCSAPIPIPIRAHAPALTPPLPSGGSLYKRGLRTVGPSLCVCVGPVSTSPQPPLVHHVCAFFFGLELPGAPRVLSFPSHRVRRLSTPSPGTLLLYTTATVLCCTALYCVVVLLQGY